MRIVMLGAPGSGKGTQAKMLEANFSSEQMSTGDLLRSAVKAGSDLGMKAKAAMDAGELVSDQIVLGLIRERIAASNAPGGFILDGYPRNRAQAQDLEIVLDELGETLDAAVLMDVSSDILMKRLTGRRTCSKTGTLLNIYFSPQADLDACIEAGGELLQREDDNEETIRNRLQVYAEQTAPLIDYFEERGQLCTVDANGTVDEVHERLLAALELSE